MASKGAVIEPRRCKQCPKKFRPRKPEQQFCCGICVDTFKHIERLEQAAKRPAKERIPENWIAAAAVAGTKDWADTIEALILANPEACRVWEILRIRMAVQEERWRQTNQQQEACKAIMREWDRLDRRKSG